jgi:hypothetical protein
MTIARNILLVLHIIAFLGILGTLLSQIPKNPKRILGGAMHSALLALITGIALVGVRTSLHSSDPAMWDEPDHMRVGIKFLILAIILVLGYKPAVSTKVWAIMIALAVVNLVIALAP